MMYNNVCIIITVLHMTICKKMDKHRAKVYKEVLIDVSAHFDVAEKFIQKEIKEIFAREKISVE